MGLAGLWSALVRSSSCACTFRADSLYLQLAFLFRVVWTHDLQRSLRRPFCLYYHRCDCRFRHSGTLNRAPIRPARLHDVLSDSMCLTRQRCRFYGLQDITYCCKQLLVSPLCRSILS